MTEMDVGRKQAAEFLGTALRAKTQRAYHPDLSIGQFRAITSHSVWIGSFLLSFLLSFSSPFD